MRALATPERVAWLRLARTPGVGSLTFARLISRFGDAAAALEALPRISGGRFSPPSISSIEDELAKLAQRNGQVLCACEPAYPPLLRQVDPPPPVLSVIGRLELLQKPMVALVGSREASAAGLRLGEALARGLGEAGIVVVSGMARGLDAAAHKASLETGTVAVLAGGLDKPYPPQNLALFEQLCADGVVVTESPLGFTARAQDFPRRNHVIAGLSLGVVVVEAQLRSGSLITARAAGEQGREVMAAPGSPLDPRARGCNQLIKQGATLIEDAADILAAIDAAPHGLEGRLRQRNPLPLLDGATASADLTSRIAALLSPTPVHVNDLARLAEASVSGVAAALTELELEGRATTLPGGYAASV
jgi:DNA processing protein